MRRNATLPVVGIALAVVLVGCVGAAGPGATPATHPAHGTRLVTDGVGGFDAPVPGATGPVVDSRDGARDGGVADVEAGGETEADGESEADGEREAGGERETGDGTGGEGDEGTDGERTSEGEESGDGSGRILGEWWGLGGEAAEAPYVGLAELGAALLVVGVGGYALAKRVLSVGWRRRLLQAHEWIVLGGVGLTVPHLVSVEELAGLGVLVALLLGIEVASGLYGRHLHRHVVRLDRGEESASVVGRALDATKRTVFARWRRGHVTLTLLTLAVLALHAVTAVGE